MANGPTEQDLLIECAAWQHMTVEEKQLWARETAASHPGFTDAPKTERMAPMATPGAALAPRIIKKHITDPDPKVHEKLDRLRTICEEFDAQVLALKPVIREVEKQVVVEKQVEVDRGINANEVYIEIAKLHDHIDLEMSRLSQYVATAIDAASSRPKTVEVEKQVVVKEPQLVEVKHDHETIREVPVGKKPFDWHDVVLILILIAVVVGIALHWGRS